VGKAGKTRQAGKLKVGSKGRKWGDQLKVFKKTVWCRSSRNGWLQKKSGKQKKNQQIQEREVNIKKRD